VPGLRRDSPGLETPAFVVIRISWNWLRTALLATLCRESESRRSSRFCYYEELLPWLLPTLPRQPLTAVLADNASALCPLATITALVRDARIASAITGTHIIELQWRQEEATT
jgi:hypothetical protein